MSEENEETGRADQRTCPRCGEPISMVHVNFEQATVSPCQHTTAPDLLSGINSSLQ